MPGKGSNPNRTTTNRAFALRKMNQGHYAHGRASPLDRALRPIKEVVGRKSSKKHERASQSSADEEDTSSVSCGSSISPIRELDENDLMVQRGGRRTAWDVGHRSRHHAEMNGRTIADKRDLRVRFDDEYEYHTRPNMDDHQASAYRWQRPPVEDREYVNGNILRARSAPPDVYENGDLLNSNDMNDRISKKPGQAIAVEAFSGRNELIGTGKVYVTDKHKAETGQLDQEIFVTPSGEEVRLRPKRGRNNTLEGQVDSRNERFSRRLSLLCNMLAEKYPGDFHILELLVELQVSNEKREAKITKTVDLMQQKIDDMDRRIALMESVSNPGLENILLPLQQATEAFNSGISNALRACQSRKETRLEIPDGKEEQEDTLEDVPDINDQDFPDLNDMNRPNELKANEGKSQDRAPAFPFKTSEQETDIDTCIDDCDDEQGHNDRPGSATEAETDSAASGSLQTDL